MGDRWPGSNAPIGHAELHHFQHRADGGTNDVDNLGSFTRDVHLNRIHKHGWTVSLDPATAMITITRKRTDVAIAAALRRTRTTTEQPAGTVVTSP